LGRRQEAREICGKGIEAASRQSDVHARDHLEAFLAQVDDDR
jgi:hypothetical protein